MSEILCVITFDIILISYVILVLPKTVYGIVCLHHLDENN
jgi:hypothetical protein